MNYRARQEYAFRQGRNAYKQAVAAYEAVLFMYNDHRFGPHHQAYESTMALRLVYGSICYASTAAKQTLRVMLDYYNDGRRTDTSYADRFIDLEQQLNQCELPDFDALAYYEPAVIGQLTDHSEQLKALSNVIFQTITDTLRDSGRYFAEEYEAFAHVRAILRPYLDPGRLTMRNLLGYHEIRLNNCPDMPVCRFYFARQPWQLHIAGPVKKGQRQYTVKEIDGLAAIRHHSIALMAALRIHGFPLVKRDVPTQEDEPSHVSR